MGETPHTRLSSPSANSSFVQLGDHASTSVWDSYRVEIPRLFGATVAESRTIGTVVGFLGPYSVDAIVWEGHQAVAASKGTL
jgi:hypothetical protein